MIYLEKSRLEKLAKRRAMLGYARHRGFSSSRFLDFFLRNSFCLDFTDGTESRFRQLKRTAAASNGQVQQHY